jgi:hypothetical protein
LVQRFFGMSQSKIDHIAETIQKIWETQLGWLASALEDKVKDVLITRAQQELQSKPRAIN